MMSNEVRTLVKGIIGHTMWSGGQMLVFYHVVTVVGKLKESYQMELLTKTGWTDAQYELLEHIRVGPTYFISPLPMLLINSNFFPSSFPQCLVAVRGPISKKGM